jgi:hypothetical protein
MTARAKEEPISSPARKGRWLTALETELKSRIGWIDEAISPFAGRRRVRARAKTALPPLQTEKAA